MTASPNRTAEVDRFLAALDHPLREGIEDLRAAILDANDHITERIKWNAPSFGLGGEDRVTFKLHPRDRIQLVFHRGAKAKASQGFAFEDTSGLLTWVAADRAVATLPDMDAVSANREALVRVVNRWIEETST